MFSILVQQTQYPFNPLAPPPTARMETEVTPAGATHENVPALVYAC
jgi:hypothetical protein